ncbi:MAG: hypothetical protein GTO18_04510 [Anaerolineales bacterium]|nr:hypothetical protein [Anaerolineales bacterium]
MKTKKIGVLALVAALITFIWGVQKAIVELANPPVETLAGRIAAIEGSFGMFSLNYSLAALLTIACGMSLAAFSFYTRSRYPLWSTIAMTFIPVYMLANLFAYLSQIYILPRLLELLQQASSTALAEGLIRMSMHTWPGSVIEFINQLAYAVLGIPSIILASQLFRMAGSFRFGALCLALSGILSILAFFGIAFQLSEAMRISMASGGIYTLAIAVLGWRFLSLPTHIPQAS